MIRNDYYKLAQPITGELADVLSQVKVEELNALAEAITAAEKVFVFAVGRVLLALQCLAKRLRHLGINVQVVGSVTEQPITDQDLPIIASGSGESKLPVETSRLAKRHGAKLGLITSAATSTIKSMSDVVVHLPCPTKFDKQRGVSSVQPMTNLFDQTLHLFGDIISVILQHKMGLTDEELWRRHANLE